MTPLLSEWIRKAEADYGTMYRESRVTVNPNYDLVCFEAQQCVEKYLKALLLQFGIEFPFTHDLVALSKLLGSRVDRVTDLNNDFARLSNFAVISRYPGFFALKIDAESAVKICGRARQLIRRELGLDPESLFE